MINGFSTESASKRNLICSCLQQGDREKKQNWPERGSGWRMCYMCEVKWPWTGAGGGEVTSPLPKHSGKDYPTGLLGGQGSLPLVPPCSNTASPAQDMILESPWESCDFCRKVKPGSLNPKWGKLKYPVHRLKISNRWREQGTTLQQPYFHWPAVLGRVIDLPAHPHPP